jgi:hypothetical protein
VIGTYKLGGDVDHDAFPNINAAHVHTMHHDCAIMTALPII